jgi:hypothetical protein
MTLNCELSEHGKIECSTAISFIYNGFNKPIILGIGKHSKRKKELGIAYIIL